MCVSCKKGNKLFQLWISFAPKVSNFAPILRPKLNPVTVPAQTQGSALIRGFLGISTFFFLFPGKSSIFHKSIRATNMVAEFNLGIRGLITVFSCRLQTTPGVLHYGKWLCCPSCGTHMARTYKGTHEVILAYRYVIY